MAQQVISPKTIQDAKRMVLLDMPMTDAMKDWLVLEWLQTANKIMLRDQKAMQELYASKADITGPRAQAIIQINHFLVKRSTDRLLKIAAKLEQQDSVAGQ